MYEQHPRTTYSNIEQRLARLEELVLPFSELVGDKSCTECIRLWLNRNRCFTIPQLYFEMNELHTRNNIRMSIHRMWHNNEIVRMGWGVYIKA